MHSYQHLFGLVSLTTKPRRYPATCLLHRSGSSLTQAIYNTSVPNLTPKSVGTKILEYNAHKQRLKLAHKYNLKGLSLENSIMTLPIKPWKTMAANNITVG